MVEQTTMESTALTEWLSQNVQGFESTELVTDHPWAQTYRVASATGVFYVKVLPTSQREALGAMESLAHLFSPRVPQVIALCADRGYLLFRDHGGRSIHSSQDGDKSLELLKMYVQLQMDAVGHSQLMAKMPIMELDGLEDRFVDFFSSGAEGAGTCTAGTVGAAHFTGERKAKYYFDRLSLRKHLLKPLLAAARGLPSTINHCDLRPQNAAIRVDGSLVLFDWDDSIVGPAGMSLHNFFGGCSVPMSLLGKYPMTDGSDSEVSALLDCYVNALEAGRYASREQLEHGLPGSICAGVMRYLMSYGKFPTDDEEFRHVIAKIIRRRTDDLLEGLDALVLNDRLTVLAHVVDYENSDSSVPAERLIHRFLQGTPNDWEMQTHLARNLFQSGKVEEAEQVCRRCLAADPKQPGMRFLLGHIGLELMDLDSAIDQWTLAMEYGSENENLRSWINDVQQLQFSARAAGRSGVVPAIQLSDNDDAFGTMARLRSRLATGLFREYGTLIVENVFSTDLLNSLHDEFNRRYWPQLQDGNPTDALEVGNRRFMVTLDMAGPFNDANLYAAPLLMSVFRRLLGDDFVLGSFTAVTALPGASDMRMHKDHPALFQANELDQPLPTFAVTMLLPLLGLNAEMGTTRVVKRSHRKSSEESVEMEFQDPIGPQGSCLLMDYRLSHQGLANRSKRVRPVLSLVYNRSWFRDSSNYKRQQPLQMSREAFYCVADQNRYLFDWLFPQ